MNICIESPSDVGNTTLSNTLSSKYFIIPEVNELFKAEIAVGKLWYYNKQVERYKISQARDYSVFDGDILQPTWYNWSYDTPPGYLTLE